MMEQAGQRYFYHADALGSVVALTDGTGAITETYRYEAFGEPEAASSLGNPYMFTGRRYDPEIGTYYYRARNYSPDLRRFMEPDPIGYVDGMNLYAYVGNSPVNFVDPTGLTVLFGGIGSSYFRYGDMFFPYDLYGSTSAGSILYGNVEGDGEWFPGYYLSAAGSIEGMEEKNVRGFGIGTGPEIGYFSGSIQDFKGEANFITYTLLGFSVTKFNTNNEWGISFSFGGEGVGFGSVRGKIWTETLVSDDFKK